MTRIYLDNAATTCPHPRVIHRMTESLRSAYANPSAMYDLGIANEKRITAVREQIAKSIHASADEITFTSGGTEGDNTIIKGVVNSLRKDVLKNARIITTAIEHPAVKDVFKDFEDRGLDVVWLPVDGTGKIDLDYLKQVMTPETVLVSIIGVHNETGTIQDLATIGKIIKAVNPACVFHTDYVQGYMKVPLDVQACSLDAVTMCAHKICGPKGVGAIYIRKGCRIAPLMLGGGQEKGFRSGTENVPGIEGFGEAVAVMTEGGDDLYQKISRYKRIITEGLSGIENVRINGAEDGSPYVVSVSFAGLRGEVLLHSLEARGVYVSTGSACSTHKKEKQSALKAMGLDPDYMEGTIRISFSVLTTEEEVKEAVNIIAEEVGKLRLWLNLKRKR